MNTPKSPPTLTVVEAEQPAGAGCAPTAGSDALPGLNDALCAYSFFRTRHVWKDRSKAKKKGRSQGLAKRIKDRSASGEKRRTCRMFIRKAREAGWRGSFIQAVLSRQNAQGDGRREPAPPRQ